MMEVEVLDAEKHIHERVVLVSPVDINIEHEVHLQNHLTDHDYLDTRPNPKPKKQKKPIKITELKAIYNCKTCGYRTMNRDVLYKHTCTKKADNIIHQNNAKKPPVGFERCPKCNFSTKDMTNLKLHMAMHIECVRKTCNNCDISKNLVNTVYKCHDCYYTTKNPTSLKVHRHIHSRGTPYKCTECDYSAKELKELITHYDMTKDLRCKCGYTTHVRSQMESHKRSHSNEKPFSCGVCNFSTKDRAALHRHMRKHSG